MELMSIPSAEQETTISLSRTETEAFIWTNDRLMMAKLDKLCKAAPETYKCVDVGYNRDKEVMDKRYVIADKSLLSFRPKKPKYTEEQKQALAERVKAYRFSSTRQSSGG